MVACQALQMRLIDTHCHLDFDELASFRSGAGLPENLNGASAADASAGWVKALPAAFVAVSVGKSNWQAVSDLARADTRVIAAFGIHPWWAHEHEQSDIATLEHWLDRQECRALGEAGLDGSIEFDMKQQQAMLRPQLELAVTKDKPALLHSVKANNLVLKMLKDCGVKRGVIHAFSGSFEEGEQFIRQGFMLGVGGVITYDRAKKTRDAVSRLPLESLVLETDSPSMPLQGYQGETNIPSRLADVCEQLAELRGVTAEAVAEQTTANALELFGPLPGF